MVCEPLEYTVEVSVLRVFVIHLWTEVDSGETLELTAGNQ